MALKPHTVQLAYCIRPNILNCDLISEIMALLMLLTVYRFVEQSNATLKADMCLEQTDDFLKKNLFLCITCVWMVSNRTWAIEAWKSCEEMRGSSGALRTKALRVQTSKEAMSPHIATYTHSMVYIQCRPVNSLHTHCSNGSTALYGVPPVCPPLFRGMRKQDQNNQKVWFSLTILKLRPIN